jgi:hypothetical protein
MHNRYPDLIERHRMHSFKLGIHKDTIVGKMNPCLNKRHSENLLPFADSKREISLQE